MRAKNGWTAFSFITCFLWNLILVAAAYYVARQVLLEMHRLLDPLLASGTGLSENVRPAVAGMERLLSELNKYLASAVFATGGIVTLLLWLTLMPQGRRLADRAAVNSSTVSAKPVADKAKKQPKVEASSPPELRPPSFQSAVQMLSILQREGRLIDFLQEDLGAYEDSQIGAAVRSIHQGCRDALSEHVELKPIYRETEGDAVTVAPGFDSRAVRLTGNVAGNPPFKGVLRHRGWRIARMELPATPAGAKEDLIVAPAEVEVQ